MPPSYADSFTSSLRETLLLNRSRISEWAEHEKEHVDVLAEQHRARAWKQQTQVDKAVTQYLTMQLHTNCNVVDDDGENSSSQQPKMTTEELMEQAEELKVEIITLRAKLDVKQATIRELKLDTIEAKDMAQSALQVLVDMQNNHQRVRQELQPGQERYQHLGLSFEKAENEILRLVFTQIDPNDPDAPFAFDLTTNDANEYVIANCQPPLDEESVEELVSRLNDEDDEGLLEFVRDMRHLFKSAFVEAEGE